MNSFNSRLMSTIVIPLMLGVGAVTAAIAVALEPAHAACKANPCAGKNLRAIKNSCAAKNICNPCGGGAAVELTSAEATTAYG